jgi:hypothetical protein
VDVVGHLGFKKCPRFGLCTRFLVDTCHEPRDMDTVGGKGGGSRVKLPVACSL